VREISVDTASSFREILSSVLTWTEMSYTPKYQSMQWPYITKSLLRRYHYSCIAERAQETSGACFVGNDFTVC